MFNHILKLHFQNNYNQQGFSLSPFVNKALELAPNNEALQKSKKLIQKNINNFNRNHLVEIYQNEKIPLNQKILITFWWGGISHQFQAPKFYTEENLKKLDTIYKKLEGDLNYILKSKNIDSYHNKLRDTYYNLKLNNGNYKLSGINTSFFTKIFQFYFQAFGQNSELVQNHFPIIADKWSKKAVLADIINTNAVNNIFQNNGNFKGSLNNDYESYFNFIVYFSNRVNALKKIYLNLNQFRLEEISFGWPRDIMNPLNPRFIANQIIN